MTKKIDRKNFIVLMKYRFKMNDGTVVQAWNAIRSYDRLISEDDREKLRAKAKHQTRLDDKFGTGDVMVCLNCFQVTNPSLIYPNKAAMLALQYVEDPSMGTMFWRDFEEEEKDKKNDTVTLSRMR